VALVVRVYHVTDYPPECAWPAGKGALARMSSGYWAGQAWHGDEGTEEAAHHYAPPPHGAQSATVVVGVLGQTEVAFHPGTPRSTQRPLPQRPRPAQEGPAHKVGACPPPTSSSRSPRRATR
jgi:hypothetical protein